MKFKKIILSVLAFFLMLGAFGCEKEDPNAEKKELLESILAGVVVDSSYKNLANDLILPDVAGGSYLITWTIAEDYKDWAIIEEMEDGKQKVVVTQVEGKANPFTLVATIEDGGISATRSWDGYVKAATQATAVTCLDAYKAQLNEYIQVTGIVTYVYDNTGFWVKDDTASFYIYVKGTFEATVGDTVTVKGTKAIYYSLNQIKDPTILIDAKGTLDVATIAAAATIDEMAAFAKTYASTTATEAEKTAVTYKYGSLYKLTGHLLENTNSDISYKYILKDEITGEFINLYDSSMNTAIKDQLAGLVGKYITGTFMFWDIHSSGYGRFIPAVAVTETTAPVATDEQKVAAAKQEIAELLAEDIVADIELFTESGLGATVSWVSSNTDFLSNEGKVGASTNLTETVTLTATITAGEVTDTVETEVTVKFPEPITVKQVIQTCDTGESKVVVFSGKIVAADTDGYFYAADSTGVVFVRTKLSTFEGLAVGDSVKIVGTTSVYLNSDKQYTRQIAAKSIVKLTEAVTVMEAVSVTIADFAAIEVADSKITADGVTAIKADAKYGAIITFEAYVSIRTNGSYSNAYFATENNTTSSALLYYHKSIDQDGVKALDGKLVTVTCVVYDASASDGWRLGSYISIAEKTA